MKQYGIETLHEHRASLEQKARFPGFPCTLGNFPTEIRQELASWCVKNAHGLNGDRLKDVSRSAYFSSLLEAASSAAAPDSRAAALMYDSAKGQVTVTSQHNYYYYYYNPK